MPGPFEYLSIATIPTSGFEQKFGSPAPVSDAIISAGPSGNLETIPALLDSGSSRTIIPHRLAIDLNLRLLNERAKITTADGNSDYRPMYRADIRFGGMFFPNRSVISIVKRHHVLIGRDILNRVITTLDGPNRHFSIE